jgi:hypothetical protein
MNPDGFRGFAHFPHFPHFKKVRRFPDGGCGKFGDQPLWAERCHMRPRCHAVPLKQGRGLPVRARQSKAENAVGSMLASAPAPRAAAGTATTSTENGPAIEERRWLRSLVRDFAKAETGL